MKIDIAQLNKCQEPDAWLGANQKPYIEAWERQVKALGLDPCHPLWQKARNYGGRVVWEANDKPKGNRGVLLLGPVGTGKTLCLKLVCALLKTNYMTATDLICEFSRNGADGLWSLIRPVNLRDAKEMAIDDIGSERETVNYGAPFPMPEIIAHRYDVWQHYGIRTHFATNLAKDAMIARYGQRAYDRLRDMCEVVKVPGNTQSLRGQR